MSTVVIAVNVTGTLDNEDRDAIMREITLENVRRAALVPPLPALLFSTAAERRASYGSILKPRLDAAHAANIAAAIAENTSGNKWDQLKKEWSEATIVQRDAILAFAQAQ